MRRKKQGERRRKKKRGGEERKSDSVRESKRERRINHEKMKQVEQRR